MLLGGLHGLSGVYTQFWWLQLVSLALLVWRIGAAPPARAAALGMLFGTAWLVGSIWWLFISMHRYGGLPAWMAALAVLLLSAFMAVFLAAASSKSSGNPSCPARGVAPLKCRPARPTSPARA